MAVVDLKSSYMTPLKSADFNNNKIADWDEVLRGLQATTRAAYDIESAPIKSQASYDISQAYENYKKTQLGLLQNQSLATGSKAALLSEVKSAYDKTTEDVRSAEASELGSLGATYTKKYLEEYDKKIKELETEASNLEALERAIWEYSGVQDFSELESLGYVKDGELTYLGRDLYAKAFLSQNENGYLGDYLYKAHPEVYKYYSKNRGKAAELIGGLTAEDLGGPYDPYKYRTDIVKPEKQKESFTPDQKWLADFVKTDPTAVGSSTNPYGITQKSAQKAVSAIEVVNDSFGSFAGTGKETEQDNWLDTLKQAAQKGQLKNGMVVDMNYGAGKEHKYVYYNGYWYPTDLDTTIKDPKKTGGKIEEK